MDLRQLQYFLHVCDADSISEAAQRAHISQPALSRQLKLLEEEIGAPLFDRHSRGIAFTDAGLMLREKARILLEDASRIRADVSATSLRPHGLLKVGTVSSLRDYLIGPSLAAFAERHKNVSFQLQEGTSLAGRDAVIAGTVDVAFLSTSDDLGTLAATRLLTEQLFLVGHSKAGLSPNRRLKIAELSESTLILTVRPNSLRVILDRALQQTNVKARVAFEVQSVDMAMHLVQLGQGLSVFPYCAIDNFLKRGLISAAPLDSLSISWAIAHSVERRLSAAARAFIDIASDLARDLVVTERWPTARLLDESSERGKARPRKGSVSPLP